LVTGQTFLPCDRLFALVEKLKKRSDAFVPEHWISIIQKARPSNPFYIQRMTQEDFLCFDELTEFLQRPDSFKVTQYCWIVLKLENQSIAETKTSHDENEGFSTHNFTEPFVCGRNIAPWDPRWYTGGMHFPRKYAAPISVPDKKFADLQKMIPYLRNEYKEFYLNLPHSPDIMEI